MLNAFCIDTEEWFHICGVDTPYTNPATWDAAASNVEKDTGVILRLLEEAKSHGTFLVVGWVAEKYPQLIKRIVDAGHEVGCHSYYHRLVYSMTPDEFEEDLKRALEVLRDISGQPVTCYRAPSFSITNECFWVYPILRKHGINIDVSMVPASRDNGGVSGIRRDPFLLQTDNGTMTIFPVSVMKLLGKTIPFSGGGYLRMFPQAIIDAGIRQNHRDNRAVMTYIHPREVNPDQIRLKLPWLKYFKYYVNLKSTVPKLRSMLSRFEFDTVSRVIDRMAELPVHTLDLENQRISQ